MTASLRPARLIIIHLNIGLSVYSLFDLMFSLATILNNRYVYIPPCLRNIMDGQNPQPTHARIQGRMKPIFFKDGDKTTPYVWVTYRNVEDAPSTLEETETVWFQSGSEEWKHEGIGGFLPVSWDICEVFE
jgi:hypothetical protein